MQTILVIDDEPAVARTLERALARLGYAVRCAADPAGALACAREGAVDAVLLDVHLADSTGDAVYFALVRERPALRGRIALMSGDLDAARERWPDEIRGCPALAKPFDLASLGTLLAELLPPPAQRQHA